MKKQRGFKRRIKKILYAKDFEIFRLQTELTSKSTSLLIANNLLEQYRRFVQAPAIDVTVRQDDFERSFKQLTCRITAPENLYQFEQIVRIDDSIPNIRNIAYDDLKRRFAEEIVRRFIVIPKGDENYAENTKYASLQTFHT